MTHLRPLTTIGVAAVAILATTVSATAHENEPRQPEVWQASERLLVSDSDSGDIVVIDDGKVVERLSTPPAPISLARSDDGETAVAIRGRNTDRDHVTMIDTGFDEATGEARRPFVSQTWIGQAPGGVSHGRLPEFGGLLGIAEEEAGTITFVDAGALSGIGGGAPRTVALRGPDHYAFVVGQTSSGDERLAAGHLRRGGVSVIDPGGEETAWVSGCPVLHGATLDESGTRAIFGCADGLLSVDLDGGSGKTPYPSEVRSASFHDGANGVRWGTTDGAQGTLHRIDTSPEAGPEVELLDLDAGPGRGGERTQLRTATSADGEVLAVLTHQGRLQIRDGESGDLRREVRVDRKYPVDFHEHTAHAEAPDVVAADGGFHVSLPRSGELLTVTEAGEIVDRLRVGGMPTRMVRLGN